ncbi:sortase [Bombilactobacillus folatiphilus]|uniref:Sortase n=1 Tax=Bombilactobacillus folatiphilus TaxID=2923362 RepID=A0ABY4P789_9LACO|nr:class A sortase [Bombilactobacillus folatiphilus]UQS81573.1 sortase [Bombilactobacillus folatiphilus]
MKKFLKYFLSILVLIIGLVLIFNGQIKDYMVKQLSQQSMTALTKDQVRQNSLKSASYDFSKVKPISAKQVAKASVQKNAAMIGKIVIPSVKLKLPIVKGVDDNALATGAGTMKPDEKMGEGNYALAGHYMTQKGALFSPIADSQIGDLIYITDLKSVYTYKIMLKQVISPKATWRIDDQNHQKLISLITCADGGANRWIVQGVLVKARVANRATLAIFD